MSYLLVNDSKNPKILTKTLDKTLQLTLQQQKIKIFQLDRKLASRNSIQILEALHAIQSQLQFQAIKRIQDIDILFNRLLAIFKTSNNSQFYLKNKIAAIFISNNWVLPKLHSKQQFISVMAKGIRNADEFTRVLILKIIRNIPVLFQKDILVYHLLLARLQSCSQVQKVEKIEAYKCLQSFLSFSSVLSGHLSKHLSQINSQGKVATKIILSLCLHANFRPFEYKQIIEQAITIVNMKSKAQKCLIQLIYIKFARQNYKLVELYYKKYTRIFPKLKSQIRLLEITLFPFLAHNLQNLEETFQDQHNIRQYIDNLFEMKRKRTLQIGKNDLVQNQLESIIMKNINSGNQIKPITILMSYFLVNSSSRIIDNQILKNLKIELLYLHQYIHEKEMANIYFIFLKQLLVTANFQSAKAIIDAMLFNGWYNQRYDVLVILKLYCEFHIESIGLFEKFQRFQDNALTYQQNFTQLLKQLNECIGIMYPDSQFSQLSLSWSQCLSVYFAKLKSCKLKQAFEQTQTLKEFGEKVKKHVLNKEQEWNCLQKVLKFDIEKNLVVKKEVNRYANLLPGRLLHLYSLGYPLFFIYLPKKRILQLLRRSKRS